jgi:hypothetical protein
MPRYTGMALDCNAVTPVLVRAYLLAGACNAPAAALVLGLNSAGRVAFGHLAYRTSENWSVRGTLVAGLARGTGAPVCSCPG